MGIVKDVIDVGASVVGGIAETLIGGAPELPEITTPALPPELTKLRGAPQPTPTRTEPEVKIAKGRTRKRASATVGRSDTILGGQLLSQPENQPRKTLLGT